jgi:DNA-binding transcriptional regulator GbsR (MarR family)
MIDERTATLQALRGKSLTILFALMLFPERSLGTGDLAAITGYSSNTITAGLRQLKALGCAQNHGRYRGWMTTTRISQMMLQALPQPEAQAPMVGAQNPTLQVQNSTPETQNSTLETQYSTLEAQNLRLPSSSSTQKTEHPTDQIQTTDKQLYESQNLGLAESLKEAGIFAEIAYQLARDPWVTQDRADRWIADLQRQNEQMPGSIRNPGGLLASNLRYHREPPAATHAPHWSDYICPSCSTHPCACDSPLVQRVIAEGS